MVSVFRRRATVPDPPAWFPGSYPEYVCYTELERPGYRPDEDFEFQSSALGGRLVAGGLVADFLFERPPLLIINVNSRYWHEDRPQPAGRTQQARDIYARQQFAGLGYTLVLIDDDDLLEDPAYYVSEALSYRDHSE